MTLTQWIITVLVAWFAAAALIGALCGRIIRHRSHHYPSPNHPAVRAHKTLHDGRPLAPHEAVLWAQAVQQLRAPDTQESQ
jgi:hypothetical protein